MEWFTTRFDVSQWLSVRLTPLLVVTHLLVFVGMLLSGVDAWSPSGESLLRWGANYKASTLNGEPWRLLTSMWIHGGIVSLLVNMAALLAIGAILEPVLGRVFCLIVYLSAGLTGATFSLWWHDLSISAGAAGAILGLYGVFVALLLVQNTSLKDSSLGLLLCTGLFLLYNLAADLKDGIDQATHIGGLLSGFLMGVMYYPTLRAPGYLTIRRANVFMIVCIVSLVIYGAYRRVPDAVARYEGVMQQFARNDSLATQAYQNPEKLGKYKWRKQLQQNGIKRFDENLRLLDALEGLPRPLARRVSVLRHYCILRRHLFRMRVNSINQKSTRYEEAIRNTYLEIQGVLMELEKPKGKQV